MEQVTIKLSKKAKNRLKLLGKSARNGLRRELSREWAGRIKKCILEMF